MQKILEEINALAKKKKTEGLTDAEQRRQKELYAIYLKDFRAKFKTQLDNVEVEYPDGTVTTLKGAVEKSVEEQEKSEPI